MRPEKIWIKKIREKLIKAFEKLDFNNKDHREILEAANFMKVIESDDSVYEPVRRLAARVGMGLEE